MTPRILPPNYTQVPNALIALMPEMGQSELKVALAIARETFGWQREWKELSISRLMVLTGLSRQGVVTGTEAGIERGIIERQHAGMTFLYRLIIHEEPEELEEIEPEETSQQIRLVNELDQSKNLTSQENGLVNELDTSQEIRPVLVKKLDYLPSANTSKKKRLRVPKESIKEKKSSVNTTATRQSDLKQAEIWKARDALVSFHKKHCAGAVTDPGKQKRWALWLAENFEVAECQAEYESQLAEKWRDHVDWGTVAKTLGQKESRENVKEQAKQARKSPPMTL